MCDHSCPASLARVLCHNHDRLPTPRSREMVDRSLKSPPPKKKERKGKSVPYGAPSAVMLSVPSHAVVTGMRGGR
jgi:hypothetical protein